jgi:hypothetical protein
VEPVTCYSPIGIAARSLWCVHSRDWWGTLEKWHRICRCATPSPALPYQDMSHFSSLIFGGLAAYTTSRELKQPGVATSWRFIGMAIVLMLAAFVLQAMLTQSSG